MDSSFNENNIFTTPIFIIGLYLILIIIPLIIHKLGIIKSSSKIVLSISISHFIIGVYLLLATSINNISFSDNSNITIDSDDKDYQNVDEFSEPSSSDNLKTDPREEFETEIISTMAENHDWSSWQGTFSNQTGYIISIEVDGNKISGKSGDGQSIEITIDDEGRIKLDGMDAFLSNDTIYCSMYGSGGVTEMILVRENNDMH